MKTLRKNWNEHYEGQNALSSEQITPGGVYRTLIVSHGDKKEKYQYGIIKLKDGSTTEVEYSYNFSKRHEICYDGEIKHDNGHVSFFTPRDEHITFMKILVDKEADERYIRLLCGQVEDQKSEIKRLEDTLMEAYMERDRLLKEMSRSVIDKVFNYIRRIFA